ncbi:hypothetical protein GJ744_010474 [Endocarpon pusillum]|uniref:Uncharacterized protein n=1 Tax=Endocarpon pusillum TaxID=364733 RepID=A0A8H7E3K6_9EURO|nr:hypothetical protein GJ744_010474 [Endocarpon pusillum]
MRRCTAAASSCDTALSSLESFASFLNVSKIDDKLLLISNTDFSRKVKTPLDFIAHYIKREYGGVLGRVLGDLEDLEPCQTELRLVRAPQAIENLTDIARRPSFLGDPAHGDLPEAEPLLGQLADLPGGTTVRADSKISERLVESLLMTSDRSREVAVLDHMPNVIRHLCKTPQRVLAETDILRRKIVHIAADTANLDLLDLITHQRQSLLKSRDLYSEDAADRYSSVEQELRPRITTMLKEAEQRPRNQFPQSDMRSRLEQPQSSATQCTSLPESTGAPLLPSTPRTPSLLHQPLIEDGYLCVGVTSSTGRVFEFNDEPDSDSRSF